MKKKYKLLFLVLTVLLCVFVFCSSAFALKRRVDTRNVTVRNLSSKNDLFLMDATLLSEGELPTGYNIYAGTGSQVTTEVTTGPDGKKNNALVLIDNNGGSATGDAVISRSFPAVTSGEVAMDFCFKLEGEGRFANGMYLMSGGSWGTRVTVRNDNGKLEYMSGGVITPTGFTQGEWYKVRVIANMDTKKARIYVRSKAIPEGYIVKENLNFWTDVSSIDGIRFETRNLTGKFYLDYFKVEVGKFLELINEDIPEFERPVPYEAPISQAPVMRAVPDMINVNVDGEYMYFATKPYMKNGEVFASLYWAQRVFNRLPKTGENWFEAVSLNKLAVEYGYKAEFNEEEQTLYITKGAEE